MQQLQAVRFMGFCSSAISFSRVLSFSLVFRFSLVLSVCLFLSLSFVRLLSLLLHARIELSEREERKRDDQMYSVRELRTGEGTLLKPLVLNHAFLSLSFWLNE